MDIYLLRHGVAAKRGAATHRDADRPLTRKGRNVIRTLAKTLRDSHVTFDLILASPLRRARETAEIASRVLKCRAHLHLSDNLKPGGDSRALVKEISRYREASRILLVGHEPSLSSLASILLSGRADLSIALKKGGLCGLTASRLRHGRCATLTLLQRPPGSAGPC